MTKREYIKSKSCIGYWSALGGIEVYDVEYGINTYLYCISNAWYGKRSYHKVKVQMSDSGMAYIRLYGYRFYFNDCIRCQN